VQAHFGRPDAALLRAVALDPPAIIAAADRTLDRVFDVLGSGPVPLGTPIDWHRDFVHGRRWPADPFWTIDYTGLGERSDVKLPWEIARCHWALWLAEAWLLTGEPRYAMGFQELVTDWLDGNPLGLGIHWACPMELAIRATNLLLAASALLDSTVIEPRFWARLVESLWWHGRVLRGNLEYERPLNNHYVSNGLGLLVLGLGLPDSAEGRGWRERGRDILEEQIRWQVHPDGVSYEKSVSYHRLVLECWALGALLGERAGVHFSQSYRARLERMFEFTAAYSRPDGTTPLVGDADDGRLIRPEPGVAPTDHRQMLAVGAAMFGRGAWKSVAAAGAAELLWYGTRQGVERWQALAPEVGPSDSLAFRYGGYYVMRSPGTHTFLDAGPLGFEGDSVHGHLDSLSLELWAPGGAFLIDSGTFCYTSDEQTALRFASTAAHNTVLVDGAEIAEWTGLWHVREDGTRPEVLAWQTSEATDVWEARHHGYARLPAPVHHCRRVTHWKAERRWCVEDRLEGSGRHRAELRWHLHPDASLVRAGPQEVAIRLGQGLLRLRVDGHIGVHDDWVAPRYGVRCAARTLLIQRDGELPLRFRTEIDWRPATDAPSTEESKA
jgi:uncharacterized heparinase superfamily protein